MGKKYGTLVICAVILFLFFGGTASAKTWYVDDDDRADFETIQGAIFDRNVTDRDTIIVRAGTYIENVEVNKSLTIQSDRGAEVTTVRANDPHEFIFKVCANYVKISGYKIEGSALPGIELCYGTNHCNISNNYCTDCDIGIALDKSNNNSISNNHCISNRDNAIDLDYSHNNSITNNICTHNIGNGIDLSNSYYNSITNNTCSLNVDSGIYLDNSNNNSIMNNTCKDSMRDSIDLWFSNNNHIYLNNFVTETGDFNCFNSINVWNTTEKVTYRYNGSMYRNYLGNYWGDRIRTDAEGDGICDDPFIIDCDQDNYPLMMPFEKYIINGSSLKETDELTSEFRYDGITVRAGIAGLPSAYYLEEIEHTFLRNTTVFINIERLDEQKMKALISVYNKDLVVEFAKALNEREIEIIATEGTARWILDNGIPVTKVSAFTGVQELLGGKVKTLHPAIHAGIATAAIGIVAVNLLPLDLSSENTLDTMDLGGVAMLRSGIKNFEHVAVIVNPVRYNEITEELRVTGHIARGTKLRLAQEASKYIVAYESNINNLIGRME